MTPYRQNRHRKEDSNEIVLRIESRVVLKEVEL
jgi:hypothetical protein